MRYYTWRSVVPEWSWFVWWHPEARRRLEIKIGNTTGRNYWPSVPLIVKRMLVLPSDTLLNMVCNSLVRFSIRFTINLTDIPGISSAFLIACTVIIRMWIRSWWHMLRNRLFPNKAIRMRICWEFTLQVTYVYWKPLLGKAALKRCWRGILSADIDSVPQVALVLHWKSCSITN